MATPTGNPGQVTVTITANPSQTAAGNGPDQTASSTLSLIYIYSTSSSNEPTAAASSSHPGSHISQGAIAGIVVGCVVFLLILALTLFCYSRRVARRRRAEIASEHPSTHRAVPSRAHSHATTATQQQPRTSQIYDTRSLGGRSQGARSQARSSILAKSDVLPPLPSQPQELPTPHNRSEMEGSGPRSVRGRRASGARVVHVNGSGGKERKQGASEVYGSYSYPVELQAGSTTDLMEVIREMKRLKTAGGAGRSISGAGPGSAASGKSRAATDEKDMDTGSEGYLSPSWPPPTGLRVPSSTGGSENGYFPPVSVSDVEGSTDAGGDAHTETATEYEGGDDERSIHIYFRPGSGWETLSGQPLSARQSKIAAAMSHASSTARGSRSTLRSSGLGNAAALR